MTPVRLESTTPRSRVKHSTTEPLRFHFSLHIQVVARVKMLIFSPYEMKYIWYLPKNANVIFILYSTIIQKEQPNFFSLVVSRSI